MSSGADRRSSLNQWLATFAIALGSSLPLAAADTAAAKAAAHAVYDKEIVQLLATYCHQCHGDKKQKGDLDLQHFKTGAEADPARKVWKRVVEQLQARDMPPEKEKQPSDAERAKVVAWVKSLGAADAPDSGRVTVRRLNRLEYNNTIRDLIGLDFKPADDFPEDDVGNGFDNIGDVLSLPPLLMEKYLIAADQILDRAVVVEQPSFDIDLLAWPLLADGKPMAKPTADPDKKGKDEGVTVTVASEVRGLVAFPSAGRYTVKVRAAADQAGTEPAQMGIKIDDKMVADVKVMAKKPAPVTLTFDAPRGLHAVSVTFMNPFSEPPVDEAKDAKPVPGALPGTKKKPAEPRVRALTMVSMDLKGPRVTPPPSHKRIFTVRPDAKNKDQIAAGREAAKHILGAFASRAYRRPVTEAQLERLLHLYDTAAKNGQVFEECVRLGLKGVLVSPSFLFRVEPDRETKDPSGIYPLDDYEVASRLSYFLWSSMPDDALFELAKQGKLRDPAVIEQQVQRMLKDPKSAALVQGFAGQWLELRKMEHLAPDTKVFPEFTDDLRKALTEETSSYFTSIMREDHSVLEFIDSDYAFLNDKLAKLYGISGVVGSQFRKVQLTDRNRGGLLGQGAILALTSMPTRTSPVKRGKWVLEQLLGDPPPPPPPMVEALDKQGEKHDVSKLSLRERMALHRTDPTCNSCHKVMDAIGFGLENFDALGRWRDKDAGGGLIDSAGKLPSGASFGSPAELKRIFIETKDKFVTNLTEKMLTYALGRGMEYYDAPTIDKIVTTMAANDNRFSVLVVEIARSYAFLYRRNATH